MSMARSHSYPLPVARCVLSVGFVLSVRFIPIIRFASFTACFVLAAGLALVVAPNPARAALILSEIADPLEEYRARFVEIANTGDTTETLAGWTLRRYANGQTSYAQVDLSGEGALAPGASLVVGYGAAGFETFFGRPADLYHGYISGNGNDVYELARNGGRIDIYGQIGVDGFGTAWDYRDSVAARHCPVVAPSTVWNASQWGIARRAPRSVMTPGSHAFGPGAEDPDAAAESVVFGSVQAGATADAVLTVRNMPSSSVNLTVTGLALAGGDDVFALVGAVPISLAPGEYTTRTLRYTPGTTAGVRHAATLGLLCNDPFPPTFSAWGRTRDFRSISEIRAAHAAGEIPANAVYSLHDAIVTARGIGPGSWAVQDATTSSLGSGAWVWDEAGDFARLGIGVGDRVIVDVSTVCYMGMLCFCAAPDTVEVVSRGNLLPEPLILGSLADLGDATEGLLVGVSRVWLTEGGTDAARWRRGVRYTLGDGANTAVLRVARECGKWDLAARPTNLTPFSLVGVGSQADPAWPTTGGAHYGIAAREGRAGNGSASWDGINATPCDVCGPDTLEPGTAARDAWIYE